MSPDISVVGQPADPVHRSLQTRGEAVFIVSEMTMTDLETSQQILPRQAPLYQLCGDHNPLHSDPEIPCGLGLSACDPARALDTHGIACKVIVDAVLDGDQSR